MLGRAVEGIGLMSEIYIPDSLLLDSVTGQIDVARQRFFQTIANGVTSVVWANIDFAGSSLADLATRSATALNSGTLPLARLSGITTTQLDAAAGITFAQLASMTDVRLVGRSAGSAGVPQEIAVGTGLSLAGGTLSASGGITQTTDTWTPADGSGAGLTFSNVEAQYVKTGKNVVAAGYFTFPVTADATTALISGLPFTPATTTNNLFGGSVTFTDEATLTQVRIVANTTTARLAAAGGGALTNAILSGNTVAFTVSYVSST